MPKDAKIKIMLPSDINVVCPLASDETAFEYNSKQLSNPLEMICTAPTETESFTIVVINNPLTVAYRHEDRVQVVAGNYDEIKVLRVVFKETTNPLSGREIRGVTVQTLTKDDQLIDTYSQPAELLFTVKSKPIQGVAIVTDTEETYTKSVFTFTLTLANKLLTGCFVEIVLPPEVVLISTEAPKLLPGINMDLVHSSVRMHRDSFGTVTITVFNFLSDTKGVIGEGSELSFGLESL